MHSNLPPPYLDIPRPRNKEVVLVAMTPRHVAALDRIVSAASAVVAGAEVGPSDSTPLEQLGEALDALHALRDLTRNGS
jgi:hypothetical protein